MSEVVYLNGSLTPREQAKISVNDQGFLYGFGLFQTVRAYNGRMFLLDRHIKRLLEAAKVIGLADKIKDIDLMKACTDTLAANKLKEARVRFTVTNGENEALPWADAGGKPTVVVTATPYTPMPETKYNEGFKVGIASAARCKQSVFSSIKSINYLLNVAARMEATSKGWDETILLNNAGDIAEAGSSNMFFVDGDKLITPSAESGIIPGVTRELIMEMAAGMGISVKEGEVGYSIIKKSKEIFLTNALIEVMPVTRAADKDGRVNVIGDGRPGEITKRLMEAYRGMVRGKL